MQKGKITKDSPIGANNVNILVFLIRREISFFVPSNRKTIANLGIIKLARECHKAVSTPDTNTLVAPSFLREFAFIKTSQKT
jgi:hypothetical protein